MNNKIQGDILIVRPKAQAEQLAQLIQQRGGRAYILPSVVIKPIEITSDAINFFNHSSINIFVSTNAIEYSKAVWQKNNILQLPTIAVGATTAEKLKRHGFSNIIMPDQYNSAGILNLPLLDHCANKKIVIFCGKNTKHNLSTELKKRGAQVNLLECYQRVPAVINSEPMEEIIHQNIKYIVVMSQEGLTNLYNQMPLNYRAWLLSQRLIVISSEMAQLAEQLGFQQRAVQANAADTACLLKLLAV